MYKAMKNIDKDGIIPCHFFGSFVYNDMVNSKFKFLKAFRDKKVSPVNLEQTDLYNALKMPSMITTRPSMAMKRFYLLSSPIDSQAYLKWEKMLEKMPSNI